MFGLENIFKNSSVAGIEVVLLPDSGWEINVVVLRKKKGEVVLEKKRERIRSFDELAKTIDVNLPIVLVINGKGIIHRKIAVEKEDKPSTLLSKVLPNANSADFAIQQTPANEGYALVSVTRLEVINSVINELKKVKLVNITQCLLGPFVINSILPLLKNKIAMDNTFSFCNYIVQTDGHRTTGLVIPEEPKENERIFITGEYLDSILLVSYAAGISYFTGNINSTINASTVEEIIGHYLQKQKFTTRAWGLLIATFSLLLINYAVFNYYWGKNQEVSGLVNLNQAAKQHYEEVKNELDQKKAFLQQHGLLENSRTSFYADRLAADVPSTIQWTDLNIFPLKKKQTNEGVEEIYFEKENIMLTGKCKKSVDLNDWIKIIKQYSWVAAASLADYKQDTEHDYALFTIKLEVKQ